MKLSLGSVTTRLAKNTWRAMVMMAVGAASSGVSTAAADQPGEAIPWNEVGTRAGAQYKGDGLAVSATESGARLRCAFQKIEGEVSPAGLWLVSTGEGGSNDRFQVMARAVGRAAGDGSVESPAAKALARTGTVVVADQRVRFIRPRLAEEYSVSMDGVRQDFVVLERPAGRGALRVELDVSGARAESAADGARLVVAGSGREIVYSRLHVGDAHGRALAARIEVLAASRLAVVVDDVDAVYPVRIDPTFTDADWSAVGTGTDNYVFALAVSGTDLYVGGTFTTAGGIGANYIAKWNGSTWSPLGTGMNNEVLAVAVSGTDLYAGGAFTTAGGSSANYIAKWNGSTWSALGTGMSHRVFALAVSGTDVYAGGIFNSAGGGGANHIAKWNGTVWSALGTGTNGAAIWALAASGTDLYAGGEFTTAGGLTAIRVAKWNGSAWSALGTGMNGAVYGLAVSGTDLYVGGEFTTAGGSGANRIAKWNGTAWSALGTGMNGIVNELAVSGTNLYVGGTFITAGGSDAKRIAKWDGTAWSALGTGLNGQVNGLAVSGTDLYVGGFFTTAGGSPANRVARGNLADCVIGTPPSCDDGIACTTDSCNVQTGSCDHTPNDVACDDGVFCNGVEICDPAGGCLPGTLPTCDDRIACTIDSCNVQSDSCDHTPNDAACDDGVFCNGVETCDPARGCLPGTPITRTWWYLDTDRDGYGDSTVSQFSCTQPEGYVEVGGDCDDADATIYPDAPEVNDGLDNECPGDAGYGVIDEISGISGFTDPSNQHKFCWVPQAGATSYQVVRSTHPNFSPDCPTIMITDTCLLDPFVPPGGQGFYYLVRALAPHVGSWGQDSSGNEIVLPCVP